MNQLLFEHQLARLTALRGTTESARDTATSRVAPLARSITDWPRERGLPLAGWPEDDRLQAAEFKYD